MEYTTKFISFILLGFLLVLPMPSTTANSDHNMKALQSLTEGNNKFSIELYQKVKKANENLVVSPISVQIVLALVHAGAKGNTAKEIASVLHLPDNPEDVLKGNKLLIEHLQSPVLKIANKIFSEKTLSVKPEFQENAKKYFQSDVGLVDFIGNPEGSRQEINHWVEEHTNNKIKDLLAQGSIDALTRMVLTNAIHFKANWLSKFDPKLTTDEDFHTSANDKVKVKMMSKRARFPYREHEQLDAKLLELPYDDKDFKMVIILPNKVDGLAEVENKLATMNLGEELTGLHEVMVNVKLPKFKIEKTMDLKDILIGMGMKDLFDEAHANLTGISDSRLYASKVVQKAFIEVNEEGTEAAAATAVVMVAYSSYVPTREENFRADHPFIYILKKKDAILFVGKVAKFS